MELVHDIFFFGLFDVQNMEKCVTNIINLLDIILKKYKTWANIVARVQIIVFSILYSYFEVVVHGTVVRYIFFGFFDVQTIKKFCHEIINVLDII